MFRSVETRPAKGALRPSRPSYAVDLAWGGSFVQSGCPNSGEKGRLWGISICSALVIFSAAGKRTMGRTESTQKKPVSFMLCTTFCSTMPQFRKASSRIAPKRSNKEATATKGRTAKKRVCRQTVLTSKISKDHQQHETMLLNLLERHYRVKAT